jgi:phosphoribosylanthranilate isomerase
MITQVYGLTTVGDATACVRLGVDNLGVVLDEGLGAWDAVELDTARAILDAVGDATPRLALSLGTDPATVLATAQVTDPDILHVARAVAFTPATLEAIRADLDPVALMCTIPVVSGDAPTIAVRYETVADYLLLDSMDQGSGVVGATGLIHDWTVSARVVAAVGVPVVLAGGLGPENVGEAISVVHPWGVDSETRTSRTDDRRRKDLERVEAFVAAATGG